MSVRCQQQIRRLDVPVYDPVAVEEHQHLTQLLHEGNDLFFRQLDLRQAGPVYVLFQQRNAVLSRLHLYDLRQERMWKPLQLLIDRVGTTQLLSHIAAPSVPVNDQRDHALLRTTQFLHFHQHHFLTSQNHCNTFRDCVEYFFLSSLLDSPVKRRFRHVQRPHGFGCCDGPAFPL